MGKNTILLLTNHIKNSNLFLDVPTNKFNDQTRKATSNSSQKAESSDNFKVKFSQNRYNVKELF